MWEGSTNTARKAKQWPQRQNGETTKAGETKLAATEKNVCYPMESQTCYWASKRVWKAEFRANIETSGY